MYALVGCSECSALWIIEGRPDRTNCPRCDRSHRTDSLKRFVETEDREHAREVRASMLAARQGEDEAFAQLDHVEALEARLDDAGIDDTEYLAASGVDPDAVATAAERATDRGGNSRSRTEIVRAAIEELETPTAEAIVDYATDRDVSASFVRQALERYRRNGEITLENGEYRLL